MLQAAWIGALAAGIALVPAWIRKGVTGLNWDSPYYLLVVGLIAWAIQRFWINRQEGDPHYSGIADLAVHVQIPTAPDPASRWSAKAFISFLLNLFGGVVGVEGAAAETAHAAVIHTRPRSARWSERRRRTDVLTVLASAVGASFGAPFAGVILAAELGFGGRLVAGALGGLVAFAIFQSPLNPESYGFGPVEFSFHVLSLREWTLVAATVGVTSVCAVIGLAMIRFFRAGFFRWLPARTESRLLVGAVFLCLLFLIYPAGHLSAPSLFEKTLTESFQIPELGLQLFVQWVVICVILSSFGSIGVLWPIFAAGGLTGALVNQALFGSIPGFSGTAVLLGASAFISAALGAPLAAAILALEVSRDVGILLPALSVTYSVHWILKQLRQKPFMEQDLLQREIRIHGGRSQEVLGSIPIGDAMETQFVLVHEKDTVDDLYARVRNTVYPFFPVVDGMDRYLGLLSADWIDENWRLHGNEKSETLGRLIEARDLLYRSKSKTPTLRLEGTLAATTGLFENTPCVPILDEERRVKGLLYVYGVRLAYERELIRRSHQSRFPREPLK